MFAIIKTGGKQYQVTEGMVIAIEKLVGEGNSIVEFEPFLIAEEDGSKVSVGTPTVAGAKVVGTILEQTRDRKIRVEKYKAKVRYHKVYGHRQHKTKVRIDTISA
ncbi:MAG: 50S ribosomal protein L21 [Candidatus Jacksonbacteria bacterium RIFCSPLOWO2_02_FULL_43_9]|nr:MAG: 50S ribosomal protein L21 [Parcubacteria group bacterium GW2011_GWA2_43_13]OGY70004.1 MAG: 50S ribosomal protein L21 [Candidatus Jacksonbacteria bacterium RIFCSPHIGHO2_02_FULL_43_10]OGY70480.1 MAG: 50S ribosomal protein L21 [Candidatus Jacksonbacteria bacterium RIFCSPLOWO2_01_FULL_44_13]OGY73039.1 MAG: 50S ribosomal protein L21 [Candidatus Jacksonbacteria bacterium RIFCSPLOWO2_02_FULL_43_9]